MGKKVTEQKEDNKVHKNSKAERFEEAPEVVDDDKHTWPAVLPPPPRTLSSTSATYPTDSRKTSLPPTCPSTER